MADKPPVKQNPPLPKKELKSIVTTREIRSGGAVTR